MSSPPTKVSVAVGKTQQFVATAKDQNGVVLKPQPSFVWNTLGGEGVGGTITSSGLYTAVSTGGPFNVTATSESVSGNAQAKVIVSYSILHNFADRSVAHDGQEPLAELALGPDGAFYGTTSGGGAAGNGTVFRITTSGSVTILHSFGTFANDGKRPESGLILGADGSFYGTTTQGGAAGEGGTVFRISLSGSVTILHSFGDGTVANDGELPESDLVLGPDGSYYGTTPDGGAGAGTVFRITSSGSLTILHSFGDGTVANDGENPTAALTVGPDGNLYGTTLIGGVYGGGTIFRITPRGSLTILYSFEGAYGGYDGQNPQSSLVLEPGGNFFGTTISGGPRLLDGGTVFGYSISSGYEGILYSFGSVATDGAYPYAGLTLGPDGNFCGTNAFGGTNGDGTVFRLANPEYDLHSFGTIAHDGAIPYAGLVLGPDGYFYGTTAFGGAADDGTVFRLSCGPNPIADND